MNQEDIIKRQQKTREIQNYDYQIKQLDEMVRNVKLQPFARLQLDCWGSFCGIEKDDSVVILDFALQHIIDKRQIAVSELEAMQ